MSGPDPTRVIPASESTAALILAAGASSRMGRVKQLLPFGNATLLSHAIAQARKAQFGRVLVVLGAHSEQIVPLVETAGAEPVLNLEWETGMGSSIHAGLAHLRKHPPEPELLAVLVADQPYVTAHHLLAMRHLLQASTSAAVAARYNGRLGVPALFRAEMYPALASIPAAAGARQLLRSSTCAVEEFPLPEAAIDVDTPEDFAALAGVRA
jgi:molybdenum cofactor cytidylyltransferase